ncbi:MAG: site-specific integrase [Nannocystaceae bacterium]
MPTLTARYCDRAKPRGRKYEVACAALRGFVLRVLPSGKKAYYVRHVVDGKDRRTRLGATNEISFADARRRALELLSGVGESEAESPPLPPMRSVNPAGARRSRRPAEAAVPSAPRVREYAHRYLSDHVERTLKPRTQALYRGLVRKIVAHFGEHRLDAISRAEVESWHASMSDIPYAANGGVRVLSNMFSRAIDWGVLPRQFFPPTRKIKLYRERRRERFLTPEERARVEEALTRAVTLPPGTTGRLRWHTAAALRLLSLTGMRRDEVLDLTWDMVDTRHRVFRLPESKTGQKVVPIGSPVLELVEQLRERARPGCPYVIYSRSGGRLDSSSITRSWATFRKTLGGLDDVRLHDLRHSAASDALMSGVPLAVVGKILGHKNPSTTARYAHISDTVLSEAVETMAAAIVRNGKREK